MRKFVLWLSVFVCSSTLFAQKSNWKEFVIEEKGIQIKVSLPGEFIQDETMSLNYPDTALNKTMRITCQQSDAAFVLHYSIYNRPFLATDRNYMIDAAYNAFETKLNADTCISKGTFEYSLMFPGREALFYQKANRRDCYYRVFTYGDILIQMIAIVPSKSKKDKRIVQFFESVVVEKEFE